MRVVKGIWKKTWWNELRIPYLIIKLCVRLCFHFPQSQNEWGRHFARHVALDGKIGWEHVSDLMLLHNIKPDAGSWLFSSWGLHVQKHHARALVNEATFKTQDCRHKKRISQAIFMPCIRDDPSCLKRYWNTRPGIPCGHRDDYDHLYIRS